jgi:hypothetical protein
MNVGGVEWWMAAIAIAVPVLFAARSAVNKRQRELRGRLRVVLHRVIEACDNYPIEDYRRTACRELREASEELKVIRHDGILSPKRRQLYELQWSIYDLATREEAWLSAGPMLAQATPPEERDQMQPNFEKSTDILLRYVERLSANFRRAINRMDNGNILTYWRYRLWGSFIVRN